MMFPQSREEAAEVVGVMCDPVCVEVMGQIVAHEMDGPGWLYEQINSPAARIDEALDRLMRVGLVTTTDRHGAPRLKASLDAMRRARKLLMSPEWVVRFIDADPRLTGVISGNQVRRIPSDPGVRMSLARLILTDISQDASSWPEAELCSRLGVYGFDVAQLRRFLIDEGLMTRNSATGVYTVAA